MFSRCSLAAILLALALSWSCDSGSSRGSGGTDTVVPGPDLVDDGGPGPGDLAEELPGDPDVVEDLGCADLGPEVCVPQTCASLGEPCEEVDDGCGGLLDCAACDDGVDCTADSCETGTGCVYTPDHGVCDDGEPCTDDVCDLEAGCTNPQLEPGSPCPDDGICSGNGGCELLGDIGEDTPLLKKKTPTTLSESNEVLLIVPGAGTPLRVWDDKVESDASGANWGTAPLEMASGDETFATDQDNGRVVAVKTGDLDGDGLDETVVLSLYTDDTNYYQNKEYRFDWPRLTILDDAEAGFVVLATLTKSDLDLSMFNPEMDSFCSIDIEVGDVDADGRDEIALAGVYGRIQRPTSFQAWEWVPYHTVLWFLDDANATFPLLHTDADTMHGYVQARITLGDIDGDEAAEPMTIGIDGNVVKAWCFEDGAATEAPFGVVQTFQGIDNNTFHELARSPEIAAGDFDGDGLDEVAFSSVWYDGIKLSVHVYDDQLHDWGYLENKALDAGGNKMWATNDSPILEPGDLNGDGKDDLVIAVEDWYGGYHEWWWYWAFFVDIDDAELIDTPYNSDNAQTRPIVAVQDVDRDLVADVVVAWNYTKEVQGDPWDDPTIETTQMLRHWEFEDGDFETRGDWELGDGESPVAVGLGDFDGDNMTVLYTGKHWTHKADSRLIIAMAMPPVWSDIEQEYGSTMVYFGTSEFGGESLKKEISSTASIALSSSAKDPFGILEVKATTKMEWGFSQSETETSKTSLGVKYFASYDETDPENYVVHDATEYHRYEYLILTHPDDEGLPQEEQKYVGTTFTLDVPVGTYTFLEPVSSFLAGGGDAYANALAAVFPQTLGDPGTYPSEETRDEILAAHGGWANPGPDDVLKTVAKGTSATMLTVNQTDQTTTAEGMSFGVTDTLAISVCGVGAEVSVGVKSSELYSVTVGEEVQYGGKVGSISVADYDANSYLYGMFIYNYQDPDHPAQTFQVINWCTEVTAD